jgi:hypothetical protein
MLFAVGSKIPCQWKVQVIAKFALYLAVWSLILFCIPWKSSFCFKEGRVAFIARTKTLNKYSLGTVASVLKRVSKMHLQSTDSASNQLAHVIKRWTQNHSGMLNDVFGWTGQP